MWWEIAPSQGMENGFVETAETLGFSHERAQSIHDANFRIWFDSWAYGCKWLTAYGFASLDATPSTFGSQTDDIYICKFTTPLTGRRPSDDSLMAHEAAHIFAAQPHVGNGLMAHGGGNGADQFTETEVESMRNKINAFHSSIERKRSLKGRSTDTTKAPTADAIRLDRRNSHTIMRLRQRLLNE